MSTPDRRQAPGDLLTLPSRLKPALPALGVASLLAAGTNAYGTIVYSGAINTFVSAGGTVNFNIDAAGINDFSLTSGGGEGGYLRLSSIGYFAAGLLNGQIRRKCRGARPLGAAAALGIARADPEYFRSLHGGRLGSGRRIA